jgi:hypothetical protein
MILDIFVAFLSLLLGGVFVYGVTRVRGIALLVLLGWIAGAAACALIGYLVCYPWLQNSPWVFAPAFIACVLWTGAWFWIVLRHIAWRRFRREAP